MVMEKIWDVRKIKISKLSRSPEKLCIFFFAFSRNFFAFSHTFSLFSHFSHFLSHFICFLSQVVAFSHFFRFAFSRIFSPLSLAISFRFLLRSVAFSQFYLLPLAIFLLPLTLFSFLSHFFCFLSHLLAFSHTLFPLSRTLYLLSLAICCILTVFFFAFSRYSSRSLSFFAFYHVVLALTRLLCATTQGIASEREKILRANHIPPSTSTRVRPPPPTPQGLREYLKQLDLAFSFSLVQGSLKKGSTM